MRGRIAKVSTYSTPKKHLVFLQNCRQLILIMRSLKKNNWGSIGVMWESKGLEPAYSEKVLEYISI